MPMEDGSYERNEVNYQAVEPQAVEPPMAAARKIASTSLLMKPLLSRGTNGKTGYTPFEGRAQGLARVIRVFRKPVATRLAAWVASLVLLAGVTAVSLVITGYSLGNLWVVFGLSAVAAVAISLAMESIKALACPLIDHRSQECKHRKPRGYGSFLKAALATVF